MTDIHAFSDALATQVETLGASLVRIDTHGRHGATGTVYSPDGLIVTAHHALEHDENLTVGLPDGRTLSATLVGRDEGTDLALLRVDATDLVPAPFFETDALKVGHLTLSLARPGKSVRAGMGIVSVLGEGIRTWSGGRLDRYIQTDLAKQWGFSGGVLADTRGRVLGVNTAGLSRGALVTVPTETVRRVVERLRTSTTTARGFLGVGTYPVRLPKSPQLTTERGLAIVSVVEGSPAASAGVTVGDLLIALDGAPIEHPRDLLDALSSKSGTEVSLRLFRAGAVTELKVTPVAREGC